MPRIYVVVIVIVFLVSNLFSFLHGRVEGYMIGQRKYEACIQPLEHAIVRLKIKNGDAIQVNKVYRPSGEIK